jgi:hypothetical protein
MNAEQNLTLADKEQIKQGSILNLQKALHLYTDGVLTFDEYYRIKNSIDSLLYDLNIRITNEEIYNL